MNMNDYTCCNSNYRYPGSRPFYDTDIDRLLFFGRDQEVQLLLHQVLIGNLVVLYAKSGQGKTSLINAGLNQTLRDKGFLPFLIRFNDSDIDPLKGIYSAIKDKVTQKGLDYEAGEENSLWQFFKTAAFWGPGNKLLTPVIILDQFEGFFALYPRESRKMFTRQLADVVNNTTSAELVPSIPPGEPFPYSDKAPNVKVVISIREDYLGQLEEMSEDIPNIFHNRFRLMPLNREQAREAIVNPSQVKDEAIRAASFKFSEDAVDSMLDFLCKRVERGIIKMTDEVESFQLQLLCAHLEDTARGKKKKWDGEVIVSKDDLGGETGMHQVLERFYDDQINRFESKDEREKVFRLCEDGLISITDRRLSLEEEALHIDIKDALIYYGLGQVYFATGKQEEALKNYQESIAIDPELSITYEALGDIFEKQRDFKNAFNNYHEALKIDKDKPDIYTKLAKLHIKKREPDKAVEIYQQALEVNIEYVKIYREIAKALKMEGKENLIEKIYTIASESGSQNAYHYLKLGDDYKNIKDYDKAIKNYKKAIEIDPDDTYSYQWVGDALYEMEKYNDAIEIFKKAIEVDPNDAYIYKKIGSVLNKLGHYYDAIAIYEKATEINPDDYYTYIDIGRAFCELGKYNDAIAIYKKATEINPNENYAYLNIGHALCELGKYNEAFTAYKKAVEIKPDDSHAYYWMGYTLYILKDYNASINEFKRVIEIAPNDAYAYLHMGRALCELGKYNNTIEVYKKALQFAHESINLTIKKELAEVYLLAGSFKKAYDLANKMLKEQKTPVKYKLAMRLISISSILFQGKQQQALPLLNKFIDYYKDIPIDFDKNGDYSNVRDFIGSNKKLSQQQIQLLLKLVSLLEASPEEELKKLLELESSIQETFK